MLTGTRDQSNQILEFILLAIKRADENAQDPIVIELNEVLKDANKILENPEFVGKCRSESVELAFYLHMHPKLKRLFSTAEKFEDISEEKVKNMCNQEKMAAY